MRLVALLMMHLPFRLQTQQNMSAQRKTLVGSGDRSERIRTYNFPQVRLFEQLTHCAHMFKLASVLCLQGRVTDHRIGVTEHGIDAILNGEKLEIFFDALQLQHQAELLSDLNKQSQQ